MIVALFGSPVRIYIFSNVGYLIAIIAALLGYFMVRQFRKDQISSFRLPGVFRWIALAMALGLTFVYFVGGWQGDGHGALASSLAASASRFLTNGGMADGYASLGKIVHTERIAERFG